MRISSFSFVLAVPFLITMAVLLPLSLGYEYAFLFPWLILPVSVLICLYIFRPQIDYWWASRSNEILDEPLINWLHKNSDFYRSLDVDTQLIFSTRAALFLHAKDFSIKATEDHSLGEEFKLLAIHEALRITSGFENYLFENFDRIILYPHAFPTPIYKKLHTLELHEEDGVILLSQPHLVNGFLNPLQYFNVGLYAWISAFIRENPRLNYPVISKEEFQILDKLYPYTVDQIKDVIGQGFVSPVTLHIHAFFQFSEKYKLLFPDLSNMIKKLFKDKK